MTSSATPLHMVNYYIGEKDQAHIHALKTARKCVALQKTHCATHQCFKTFNLPTSYFFLNKSKWICLLCSS